MLEQLESRVLMARVPGIDVSHWQGTINWSSVAAAGKQFVFTKATEGTDYVDPTVAANTSGARAAGLLAGVYHFAHPDTNTASAEAQHFLSAAANYLKSGFMRPVLDLEDGASIGKVALSQWVVEWCDTVKAAIGGFDPIIYCNTNYASNFLDANVLGRPLWIANWSTLLGDPNTTGQPPTGIFGVDAWSYWQHSSTGSVSGIGGNVDLDVFNGDHDELVQQSVIPPHAMIRGRLFNDVDGDGVKDANEGGLGGRTVWIDHDGDGDIDADERTTLSASNGFYEFDGVAEGTYVVRQLVPAGWTATKPIAKRLLTLADGEQRGGANFGSWQNVTISGYVYHDSNKNGLRDPLESPLARWQVYVDADNDGVLDPNEISVRSNNAGKYTFTTLTTGTYTIRIVQQPGWRRTTQSLFLVALGPGESASGRMFGEKRIVA
jgi:GH25 family lysozyme M1 (1,4-beta-N-acetylmuramidase)